MKSYGVAFFSGGKDGLYAVYLAQKESIDVKYLLTLKTTIGLSPHYENLNSLKDIAKAMGKKLVIFDMKMGSKSLADFISSLNVDYLIGGDIFLEPHYEYLKNLGEEIGIKVIEPLWKRSSIDLAKEVIENGFRYVIIAVNKGKLPKKYLGYQFRNLDDLERFVKNNPDVDPMGECGEYHTVVISSPLYSKDFEFVSIEENESSNYYYLKFEVR